MAYRANPFLERMSERTASDQDFVRLFSPKILERLGDEAFVPTVHIFRSPPGGGKTTLLRALTPSALRSFWNARHVPEMDESYQRLLAHGVLNDQNGAELLGVYLSCAAGYADLPPGATSASDAIFRALLNCRVVLRTMRSLAALVGVSSTDELATIRLEYTQAARDLKSIPISNDLHEVVQWAEQRERTVYAELDSIGTTQKSTPSDIRFESALWLQSVRFVSPSGEIAPKRLLMIDDLHKLRQHQRLLLTEELTEMRPSVPIWLAERSIALGDELISQGVREGRDVRHYPLEEIWGSGKTQSSFISFAQNILDRRLDTQSDIPRGSFSAYLRAEVTDEDLTNLKSSIAKVSSDLNRFGSNPRYLELVSESSRISEHASVDALCALVSRRILLSRDAQKRQMNLGLGPLSAEDLDEKDNSQVQGAAEIFVNEEFRVPYYFGIERLCSMATSNVEELLTLAASLYEGLRAKKVLRKVDLQLSPAEQEKLLRDSAKKKRDFVPKNHTEGTRAQRLLDSVASFCKEKTFLPNAPYAPGVTGVRLSQTELNLLTRGEHTSESSFTSLRRVLAECVAENLLVKRPSSASSSRESGTVFYLNRTLCAHYGLPLQYGGWQDVTLNELVDWMEHGRARRKLVEAE